MITLSPSPIAFVIAEGTRSSPLTLIVCVPDGTDSSVFVKLSSGTNDLSSLLSDCLLFAYVVSRMNVKLGSCVESFLNDFYATRLTIFTVSLPSSLAI